MDIQLVAERNFFALSEKSYPGRGLIIGMSSLGKVILVYWIMGRSENSRNRRFVATKGRLSTEAVDPSKMKDPSLVIYNAMDECAGQYAGGQYVVSNGAQTDTIILRSQERVEAHLVRAMREYQYEPDEPNFTPRIAGVYSLEGEYWGESPWQIGITKRLPGGECTWQLYEYSSIPHGFGYGVHTYIDDGNPLPSWRGEPLLLPLVGSAEEIADRYWDLLDDSNRISLAVKSVDQISRESKIHIINRY